MIGKVISGGQTGADMGGLKGARDAGVETGGTAPAHYMTERGRSSHLKEFGLVQHKSPKYPPRTVQNIHDSDLTLLFADKMDGGSALTRDLCFKLKKPIFHISLSDMVDKQSFSEIVQWVKARHQNKPLTVNVAGNRESKTPGIERMTRAFVARLLNKINGGSNESKHHLSLWKHPLRREF